MAVYRESEVAFTTAEWFDAQVNTRSDEQWWEDLHALPKEFDSWERWERLQYLRDEFNQYGW